MAQIDMINVDVVIFGGGIAGLWTLARLSNLGFNALLIETDTLGGGQTIKSQGIIHGGLKYALTGQVSANVTSLQDMPNLWQQCLNGNGEIDLQNSRILSTHQNMWSVDRLTGGITTLFASNAMNSHVEVTNKASWPQIIQTSAIQSKLYQLAELVLDIPSVLKALATPLLNKCIKADSGTYSLDLDSSNNINHVTIKCENDNIQIKAQKYIFTAGSGNAQITQPLPAAPTMQLRPLQMVLVKSKNLSAVYGHCISLNTVPRITITTHTTHDDVPVWYLGGKLAEDGVHRTSAQQIAATKQELHEIFPNLNLNDAEYATFFVDRAEAKQADGSKPASITVFNTNNYITAWPTKLALAPILAQEIINLLDQEHIKPFAKSNEILHKLPQPLIAKPIWDQLL